MLIKEKKFQQTGSFLNESPIKKDRNPSSGSGCCYLVLGSVASSQIHAPQVTRCSDGVTLRTQLLRTLRTHDSVQLSFIFTY